MSVVQPPAHRRAVLGGVMVLGSAACYATLPMLAKLAFQQQVDSIEILALRFGMSAPPLIAYVVWRWGAKEVWPLIRAIAVPSLLYCLQTFVFFESLARTSAVVAVIVLFSYPLLVSLGAAVFLGETLTMRSACLVVLGTIGVALSVGFAGYISAIGVLLAGLSALLFAVFFLLAKRILSTHEIDAITFTALVYVTGGIGFPLVAICVHAPAPHDGTGWLIIGAIALVGTVLATLLLFSGLKRLNAGLASMLSAAEPPIAVALAAIFLSEPVMASQLLGMALVVTSLVALFWGEVRVQRIAGEDRGR